MSVGVPEPPPPPPPPSSLPARFDFVRPLAFVFDDPRWIPKILLGGVFALAAIFLIGIFFIYGYVAQLVRNAIDGMEHPLPEWDDLGQFFVEGLRLFFVTIVYALPFIVIVFLIAIPLAIAGNGESGQIDQLSGLAVGCVVCVLAPLALALSFWMPGALLMSVVSRRFAAAFEFGRIARFIRANIVNYLLAFVVWLVARFAAGFAGIILLCIGIIFTQFWAVLVGGYAFAQVYRTSEVK